jgi:exosortase
VGILILAAGWAVHAFGYVADPVIWRTGAVLTAVGAFVAAVGFDAAFRFGPVLAASIFLIPVDPYGRIQFAVPLQSAAASITQGICDLLGMYVDRNGNLLSINNVDITVAEACNGMRMVLTLFMVCYVVAFTIPLRWWVRGLLLVASPLVAIVANVLRLVPTVWMFGHKSIEAAEKFHTMSGWVMTGLAFLLLMLFARLLERITESPDAGNRIVPKRLV